jgi:hypothetical protein
LRGKYDVAKPADDYTEPFGKELLTASEVAKLLRINVRRVRNWGRKGWLTPCLSQGKIKFLSVEVAELQRQLNKPKDDFYA